VGAPALAGCEPGAEVDRALIARALNIALAPRLLRVRYLAFPPGVLVVGCHCFRYRVCGRATRAPAQFARERPGRMFDCWRPVRLSASREQFNGARVSLGGLRAYHKEH